MYIVTLSSGQRLLPVEPRRQIVHVDDKSNINWRPVDFSQNVIRHEMVE